MPYYLWAGKGKYRRTVVLQEVRRQSGRATTLAARNRKRVNGMSEERTKVMSRLEVGKFDKFY